MKIIIGVSTFVFVMFFLFVSFVLALMGKVIAELACGVLWISEEMSDIAMALTKWIEIHCVRKS